jgi:protoheme IX farnesyltransferase
MKLPDSISTMFPSKLRYLALSAALMMFLVIMLGGMVRVTGSGGSCPDWPTCLGNWTPPAGNPALMDYMHRLVTFLVAPLLLVVALVVWRRYRLQRWIILPSFLALALFGIQVILGAFISLVSVPAGQAWVSAIHLGISLVILALVLVSTVAAFYLEGDAVVNQHGWGFHSSFARLVVFVIVLSFILLISGAIVAGSGATTSCGSWPWCNPLKNPAEPALWLNLFHRLVVGLTAIAMLVMLVRAWRTQRSQPAILVAATAAVVLFFSQALLGAKLVSGFQIYLLGLHQATAVAFWGVLSALATAVAISSRTVENERVEQLSIAGRKGLLRDFLMLTKPIVVALLLVTTFAGMVIGAQSWPPVNLVFWTLLGGFMAAGGSGAINQYIDRYDDTKMQRTQKRPIPSGRMTPAEGLAFGVAMSLASFYIMVAFVNFLAALLSLAGIIYYVLIYSIFLKKTTVQNIVIGGGAGAIPPLVGWAAATGSLNIPSLFLFAVIFMWTPPHFWALALVRRKDYARAGVPMLPVVRGEKETRWQIFLYTLELVGLTLLLPLFGLGGSIYLIGAAVLGVWLLYAAWKVWKEGGNKLAWKMYRYSSMYLAFIFIILMVDRLL